MKKALLAGLLAITLLSCGNGNTAKASNRDTVSTMTDTITDITNPGVGSASDDTAARPH